VVRPFIVTLVLALLASGGCAVRTPAHPERAASLREVPARAWPDRDARRLTPLIEDVPRLVTVDRSAVMMIDGSVASGTLESSVRLVRTRAHGRGVIRELEYVDLPRDEVERGERNARFERALASLPPKHRTVLALREVQGLSYDEIAQAMKCRPGTVMSRLFHARRLLVRKLKDQSCE